MKAVFSYALFFIEFEGESVEECFFGDGVVEGCVKDCDVCCVREKCLCGFYAFDVDRVVEGCEEGEGVYCFENGFCDDCRIGVVFSTVYHTVAYQDNFF